MGDLMVKKKDSDALDYIELCIAKVNVRILLLYYLMGYLSLKELCKAVTKLHKRYGGI